MRWRPIAVVPASAAVNVEIFNQGVTPMMPRRRMCSFLFLAVTFGATVLAPSLARADAEPISVTAKLVEIPSSLPPDDLYDYAYVMRYEVIGGPLDKSIDPGRALQAAAAAREDQGQDEGLRRAASSAASSSATCTSSSSPAT